MDRKKIVERFFSQGVLLTPEMLEKMEREPDIEINNLLHKKHGLVLQKIHDVQENVKILMNLTGKPPVTKEDQLRFYMSKYEKMRKVITERLQKNFVSLNKLDSLRSEVYVIGIVKDIREEEGKKTIELEDTTSTVPAIFNQEVSCELDDVVAVQAISGGKVLFGKKILYPDIPLRKPVTGHGKACFISDLHLNEVPKKHVEAFFHWLDREGIEYLFVAGDTVDFSAFEEMCGNRKVFLIQGNADTKEEYPYLPRQMTKKNITSLSNPSMIYLNGLKILMMHDFDINMLKKRYLGRSSIILPEEFLVLEEVPDIVHYGHTHKPFVSNYKSTTLVNSGSPLENFMPVIVDFATREWKQESFNI
jgi:DNA polymerase II small subunit